MKNNKNLFYFEAKRLGSENDQFFSVWFFKQNLFLLIKEHKSKELK